MLKVPFIALLILWGFCVFAQDKERLDSNSSHKVLLHFDKGSYYPGDTVFFKAYLYSDFTLDQSTTNIFVLLYNENGDKLIEKRFPVLSGLSYGNLELSDTLNHGFYYFQVLTPAQLINNDSLGYLRQLLIVNPSRVPLLYKKLQSPAYNIHFYPQGGRIIEGLSNQVDFISSDQYGNTVPVKGSISDSQGNTITEFSNAAGKGSFFFLPSAGTYTARVKFNDIHEKVVEFPSSIPEGATIRVTGNLQAKQCMIESSFNKPIELELLGMMNETSVMRQPLGKGPSYIIKLPTEKLPSGTLHLAVADKEGNVYAQTSTVIDNKEYLKKAELLTTSVNLDANEENELTFDFKDSLWASLSLSIVDLQTAEPLWSAPGNIIEDALFNNERTGSWSTVLKLPDWKSVFFGGKNQYKHEDFISFKGTVYKEGTKKPVTGGQVNFLISTSDSSSTFIFVPIDDKGRFEMNNLIFEDTASFYYQMNKGKGGPVTIEVDKPTLRLPERLPVDVITLVNHDRVIISDTSGTNPLVVVYQKINADPDKYKTLEEVKIVTGKKRNPTVLVNQRYTSGLFSNLSQAKVMDFINDPPTGGGNIFDYIASKLPGVRVRRQGLDYILESPRALSIGNMTMGGNGLVDGLFFLNEVEVQSRDISSLSLSEIALVKYFPPGTTMIAYGSIAPVLAVYTKQNEDQQASFRGMGRFKYPGYSPTDLMYDDDFSQYYKGNKGVILWKPELFLAGQDSKLVVKFKIPYKLNSIRILLQGVTLDGELIYFEKKISR